MIRLEMDKRLKFEHADKYYIYKLESVKKWDPQNLQVF